MKIKSLPETERPIEKSIYEGVERLSNTELLAVLLSSGTREKSAIGLAEDIISHSPEGISYLACCSHEELMKISGVGPAKAARIIAAVELGKRISRTSVTPGTRIKDSEDIARMMIEDLRAEKREFFKVVLLDAQAGVIAVETISIGELSQSLVHPRELFNRAVRRSAAAVVLVHNHPSGDPTPSHEDERITGILVEAGQLLGIRVVDHIIVGDGRYVSLRDMGKL